MFKIVPPQEPPTARAEDFFSHFREPLEQFDQEPEQEVSYPPGFTPQSTATQSQSNFFDQPSAPEYPEADFLDVNTEMGEMLVESGVGLIAFLIATFVAKNSDTESYLLPEKDVNNLKKLVSRMVPVNQPIMSPWLMFFVTLATAYTPVVSAALKDRELAKLRQENEQKEEEMQRMREELEKLKTAS